MIETTLTDPTTIDLDNLETLICAEGWDGQLPTIEIEKVVKLAIALRERVAILEHDEKVLRLSLTTEIGRHFEQLDRAEAAEACVVEFEAEKRAPVQGYSAGIPWSMHLRAYDVYCKKYSPQPALINLEKRGCRGGFGTEELDEFIPGWRDELSEIVAAKAATIELAKHLDKTIAVAADAVNRMNAAETEGTQLRKVLEKVKQACLFTDDDAGEIGVTTDPHIPSELFAEICAVLQPPQAPAGNGD